MSDRKLSFDEWKDVTSSKCGSCIESDSCEMVCQECVNDVSAAIAWNFCEAQEKREYELLESEHSELLANFCKVDMERIKLSREINELKIKFSEATKTYTDEIEELEKKIEELEQRDINRLFHKAMTEVVDLRKKLGEAVEVIKFYADRFSYSWTKHDSEEYYSATVVNDDSMVEFTEKDGTEFKNLCAGKRARAFLKGNKDE